MNFTILFNVDFFLGESMPIAWAVTTVALFLCAIQFFNIGGVGPFVISIVLFLLTIFSANATRLALRGFRPTQFDIDDEVIDEEIRELPKSHKK